MQHAKLYVQWIGPIWQPGFECCAAERTVRVLPAGETATSRSVIEPDINEPITPATVEQYLHRSAGDFSGITDWRAEVTRPLPPCECCGQARTETETVREWEDEDSEFKYIDAMYGTEE